VTAGRRAATIRGGLTAVYHGDNRIIRQPGCRYSINIVALLVLRTVQSFLASRYLKPCIRICPIPSIVPRPPLSLYYRTRTHVPSNLPLRTIFSATVEVDSIGPSVLIHTASLISPRVDAVYCLFLVKGTESCQQPRHLSGSCAVTRVLEELIASNSSLACY
jgi:hypothetical protein